VFGKNFPLDEAFLTATVVFRNLTVRHWGTSPRGHNQNGRLQMKKFNEMPDQLESLFGAPPLLEGEDPELYSRLRSAVIDDHKPQTLADWIYVNDLVIKLWEEQRFRRASTALIRSGMQKAVEYFLKNICLALLDVPEQMALKYFSTDPKEREEITSLLAQHGITASEIQAKAAQLESGGVLMFDRMIAARESGRRLLRKEAEHYARRQENDPGDVSDG
jgi:hypothetical protein